MIMFYDALDRLLHDPGMVARLEAGGRIANPEFIFSACKANIGVLNACDGELLGDIALHLRQDRSISAMEVCKLVDGIVADD